MSLEMRHKRSTDGETFDFERGFDVSSQSGNVAIVMC